MGFQLAWIQFLWIISEKFKSLLIGLDSTTMIVQIFVRQNTSIISNPCCDVVLPDVKEGCDMYNRRNNWWFEGLRERITFEMRFILRNPNSGLLLGVCEDMAMYMKFSLRISLAFLINTAIFWFCWNYAEILNHISFTVKFSLQFSISLRPPLSHKKSYTDLF